MLFYLICWKKYHKKKILSWCFTSVWWDFIQMTYTILIISSKTLASHQACSLIFGFTIIFMSLTTINYIWPWVLHGMDIFWHCDSLKVMYWGLIIFSVINFCCLYQNWSDGHVYAQTCLSIFILHIENL